MDYLIIGLLVLAFGLQLVGIIGGSWGVGDSWGG